MQDETLLPSGFYDLLPPQAARETKVINVLLNNFTQFGYNQVKPPLMEFEQTLIPSHDKKLSTRTFRVIDPLSYETMAIRADITGQIARIAKSRLNEKNSSNSSPVPLRLCYVGQTLRVKGSNLNSERQLSQAGIELIGADTVEADAEVIMLAADSLAKLKIKDISIDFNLPKLSRLILDSENLSPDILENITELINQKDVSAIRSSSLKNKDLVLQLIECAGPAEIAVKKLGELNLTKLQANHVAYLKKLIVKLQKVNLNVKFTIDPLEQRGFEYHTGVSFSIFSKQAAGELGRGGRYEIENNSYQPSTARKQKKINISANGFSLYVNRILPLLQKPKAKPKLYLPFGTDYSKAQELRDAGYIVICSLEREKDIGKEAKRLGCTMVYKNGKIAKL